MIYLYLIVVLLVLWAIDGYLTINVFKKYGPDAEENPILKQLLRHNVKYFLLFKLADAVAFAIVIFLIVNRNEIVATALLTIFVFLYAYVNWKNYMVFKERD